jgi:glycerol-3-phosphate acyltransferase PlsY
MLNIVYLLIAGLMGYFCGAVPFGYMYVKARKNIDLREVGSGRTGGTNSFRAAGLGVGLVTSFSDVFKGFISVWLARLIFTNLVEARWLPWVIAAAAVMSVVGHNWSIFLKWGGGAGTGPNVGWAAALWWPILPLSAALMILLLLGIGMASVASLAMAAIIPITFTVLYYLGINGYSETSAYIVTGLLTASAVTWALRPNIKRLLNGTERVVGPRARRSQMKNAEAEG